MRRGLKQAGVLSVVVALSVVACGGNSDLTVEELAGTWRAEGTIHFVQLNADGSYRIGLVADAIEDSTVDQGHFTLEGTLFTYISSEDSPFCAEGDRGSYEMEVLEDGASGEDRFSQVQVEDECGIRDQGDVILERLS